MLLRRIEAEGFLSFGDPIELDLDAGLTLITGPNGAGKSNLARCLDLARLSIGRDDRNEDLEKERLSLYEDAGFEGSRPFIVRLAIDLDTEWERELIWTFVCTCFAHGPTVGFDNPNVRFTDERIRDSLAKDSLAPLWSGRLIVHSPATSIMPWSIAWEFSEGDASWHIVLGGNGTNQQLRPGRAEPIPPDRSYVDFFRWLNKGKREDGAIDFRTALRSNDTEAAFNAEYHKEMTQSLQELTSALNVNPDSNHYGFDQVLSAVFSRHLALTDNRRLPFRRYFSLEELKQRIDLRDGAAVAAELYRLKNGYEDERGRFEEIKATFRSLTGRELDVRSRPEKLDNGASQMIIEPTVAGFHAERLVELSGAGMQEALVLSMLLQEAPGRVVVLDEPAVNLEPTVQRRMIGRIRGPGQYIVITHSADMVPVEEPDDIERIVRIAPGRSGSSIRRWQSGNLGKADLFRQLSMMEPGHVRGLLFAAGVILCEGATEVGALPRWWRRADIIGLPDPQSVNIPVISVDGDGGFGAYVRYLDAFGVPWAIVADGPTLRPDSKLAKQFQRLHHWPGSQPEQKDFAQWRCFWEDLGVFTLADQFGDDGSKSGEFEAYLQRVDQSLLAQAETEVGRHKPRVGAYFATSHPEPPEEVLELYRKLLPRLMA